MSKPCEIKRLVDPRGTDHRPPTNLDLPLIEFYWKILEVKNVGITPLEVLTGDSGLLRTDHTFSLQEDRYSGDESASRRNFDRTDWYLSIRLAVLSYEKTAVP